MAALPPGSRNGHASGDAVQWLHQMQAEGLDAFVQLIE
jgi:hypothetical protein